MSTPQAKTPRQGNREAKRRRTCLVLDSDLWNQLKAIQAETGVPPSWTVRRILQRHLPAMTNSDPAA